jgi:hypothetical protein
VIACFVAGTKVTLADGKTKNIEDIGEGESVRTFDESTGQITVSPVEEVFHHEESLSELYTFEYSDGKKVTSNDIHLFYSVNVKNYLPAKEIYSRWMRGQEMLLMTDNHKVVTVKNITRKVETVKLYNIHVTSAYDGKAPSRIGHNYFENGILVHNEKAWMTVCDGLGLEVNDKNNGCLPNNFGPYSGHNVECCEANGGWVDLDPSYPRRGFCYGIKNCNGFNACMGRTGCTTCASQCAGHGGGSPSGGGCLCNDGQSQVCK